MDIAPWECSAEKLTQKVESTEGGGGLSKDPGEQEREDSGVTEGQAGKCKGGSGSR